MHLDLYKLRQWADYTVVIDGRRIGLGLCLDEALYVVAQEILAGRGLREMTRNAAPGEGPEPENIAWKLELTRDGEDDYTVIWGERFARGLVQSEALGTVASVMFDKPLPWMRTYEAWAAAEKTRGPNYSEWSEPVAMLAGPA